MIISKTPLRMSFAGGGSDLKEYYKTGRGAVVSTTINKYLYILVNKRFSDNIRVSYSSVEEVKTIDEIKHNLVREALKKVGGITKGVDITYLSDMLPAHEGYGLGASSSVLVGTLHALYAYKGEYVSASRLAKEASEIEINILGHPIGKQDQYAAAFGGFNLIEFNADETVFVNPVLMKTEDKKKLRKNLLLFHTALTSSSEVVLTEQKKNTNLNLEKLDEMVKQTNEVKLALESGNIDKIGKILHEGWLHKQKLASSVSNAIINEYYDKAIAAGALGGKILGSGGGGFLLFYCKEEHQDAVRAALSSLRELKFKFEPEGSKIIYVGE